MPDMNAQPAATTTSMETVQTYAATTAMPDMTALNPLRQPSRWTTAPSVR